MKEFAQWSHQTVMLREAVQALVHRPDGHYVDATFGRGGHTQQLLKMLGSKAKVTAYDKDYAAIQAGQDLEDERFQIHHCSYTAMAELPQKSIAGILMDLGVSSPQLDDASRGFSFLYDGPLDMRMDATRGLTAAQWLAQASVEELKEVFHEYGQERYAYQVAKAIVATREQGVAIERTAQLARIVAGAVKTRQPGKNPATRTFQAIRIFINRELEELQQALEGALNILEPGGRIVVISFHSLEDRIVKQFFSRHSRESVDRSKPWAPAPLLRLRVLGRWMPQEKEIEANPRARSAVMRVAERLDCGW